MEAEDLIEVVDAMPSLSEINRLDLILQKNKNHAQALEAMGDQLKMIGFFQTSIEYYERAIKTTEIKRDAAKRESMMIAIGSSYLELQAGEQAVSAFERILKEFPRSEKRPELLLGQARGYYFDGKDNKAQQLLRSIVEEYPNSETAKTAQQLLAEL
jgi:tetratricopeptide (TPR) repeat protein